MSGEKVTIGEAARRLNLSEWAVMRLLKEGRMRGNVGKDEVHIEGMLRYCEEDAQSTNRIIEGALLRGELPEWMWDSIPENVYGGPSGWLKGVLGDAKKGSS